MNHTRYIKNGSIKIAYNCAGFSNDSELKSLDGFMKGAYNMSNFVISKLTEKSEETEKFLSSIYGEDAKKCTEPLIRIYRAIVSKIASGMKGKGITICREKVFIDKDGKKIDTVLSSANLEKGYINIFTAFFKNASGDDKNLNDRSSVILHEIAHLNGLQKDDETESLESAECLRNFTILICEIVNPEDLFIGDKTDNQENAELVGKDGELPNNPNRQPAGAEGGIGGQFAPKEGGESGGSAKDGEKGNSDGNKNQNPKKPKGKAPENALSDTLRFEKIDKYRQATGESGNLEDMFNVGSYESKDKQPERGAWGAINFYDEGYEKNSDVSVIVRIEYEVVSDSENENDAKIDTKKIDVVYDGKADENGCVKIDRISILNQIEKDGDVVNRPSHINIKVDISTAQGRPKEVLGEDNVSQKNDIPQDDITSYAAEHASSEKKSTYGTRDGAEGGVVKNDAQGKNEKPVFSGKIRVDMYAEKVTPINK